MSDFFQRTTLWKVWFLLLVLFVSFSLLNKEKSLTFDSKSTRNDNEEMIRLRARDVIGLLEDRILNNKLDELNALTEVLRSQKAEPGQILESWLNEKNDVVAVSLWLEERTRPIRIIQRGFWALEEVANATAAQRRELLAYLFPGGAGSDKSVRPIKPEVCENLIRLPDIDAGAA